MGKRVNLGDLDRLPGDLDRLLGDLDLLRGERGNLGDRERLGGIGRVNLGDLDRLLGDRDLLGDDRANLGDRERLRGEFGDGERLLKGLVDLGDRLRRPAPILLNLAGDLSLERHPMGLKRMGDVDLPRPRSVGDLEKVLSCK